MLALRRLWSKLHLHSIGVATEAFTDAPLAALARAAERPDYAAWAAQHRLSASSLRRLLTDDRSPGEARRFGTALHERHARAIAARALDRDGKG